MIKRSPLPIKDVVASSPAGRAGIRSGDRLVAINGKPIRDAIDFQFYSSENELLCTFLRNKNKKHVRLFLNEDHSYGFIFEPMAFMRCGNHCQFCFIDQNPSGLRDSLYLKDEDYRLSFLYGNYVTLTTSDQDDLNRIVEQRLSPLYLSIHATDSQVRLSMLGLRKDDRLLDKIRFLAEHNIEMHGQIVLCPGINDGKILTDTIVTLAAYYPIFRSLAVVPVGLTKHRHQLPPLKPVDGNLAKTVLKSVKRYQKKFMRKTGSPFVFLADEFYLLADAKLPSAKHYGDFWQIDNGIGMMRSFLDEAKKASRSFPRKWDKPVKGFMVTGELAGPVLKKKVVPKLNRIKNFELSVQIVPNNFYGRLVTVSGLLTGRDILQSCMKIKEEGVFLLPANCLNSDGLFLDNLTVDDLQNKLSRKVCVLESISNLPDVL